MNFFIHLSTEGLPTIQPTIPFQVSLYSFVTLNFHFYFEYCLEIPYIRIDIKNMKELVLLLLLFIGANFYFHISTRDSQVKESDFIEVDFSIPSGKPRLFVYEDGQCIDRSLCPHGNGKGNTILKPKFSNEIGSKCSSLGRFRIVGSGKMSNGYDCLILKGLEKSNSNAYVRHIYIHKSKLVDVCKYGVFPLYLPLTDASNGCFAVSSSCYNTIKNLYNQNNNIIIYAHN